MELKIKQHLYNRYPRPLTKKEKQEIEEEKDKEEMEEYFQKLYGPKGDSDNE